MLSLEANYNIGRSLFSYVPDGNSFHILYILYSFLMSGNTNRKAIKILGEMHVNWKLLMCPLFPFG
jgi:hypothetical protein